MFKNYLKVAFRNMRQQKLDTLLNIGGLSLGIACSLLILFHIKDELSYDRHFSRAGRIYRVTAEMREGDNVRHWATTSPVLAEHLVQHIPEIETTCRLFPIPSQVVSYLPENDIPRRFELASGFFADQAAGKMFDFQFIRGNPATALTEVNSIVLTESTAKKFFPDENPLGKLMSFGDAEEHKLLKITGVIKDLPSNSHIEFSYLLSFPTFYVFLREIGKEEMAYARGWAALYNYVLLKNRDLKPLADSKLPEFTVDYFSGLGSREEILSSIKIHFQPIVDIHLHSQLEQEFEANSDIVYIYVFSATALFIMIIAGVNFVNISIAQALKRLKEVGVRKILGARKHQLVRQIVSESFLLIVMAVLSALFLLETFLPFYNHLSGKHYIFLDIFTSANALLSLGIILTFGIITSLYPAFFVSRFNPLQSIRGLRDPLSSAVKIRKVLVIFQFAISVFMIFSTIITYRQVKYFENKSLGFDKENVIAVKLNNDLRNIAVENLNTLKNELLESRDVVSASLVSNIPGDRLSVEHLQVDGAPDTRERAQFRFVRVDKDYPRTLNLKLLDGRDFSDVPPKTSAFIINEKAARALEVDNPVGRMASSLFGTRGEVVGIAKDFHFASLHNVIEPLVIEYFPIDRQLRSIFANYLLVKMKGGNVSETLDFIKTKIEKIAPGSLFLYSFLNQDLNRLYKSENRISNMFKAFALFAIIISCMGLFGLSSYSVQQRIKEVGIRKVMGATVANIIALLSKEYTIWVLIANLVAWPAAYIAMNSWLQNFAYRINIGIWTFILSGVLALVIALLTVSYQAIKAAVANPVEALRYE